MSETKTRKLHPAALKARLGLEALRGVKLPSQIGQEHGVHPVLVGQWKKAIQDNAGSLFEGKRGVTATSERTELEEQLYAKIGRLEMDLAWLKKKSGL